MANKNRLGKGLGALINESSYKTKTVKVEEAVSSSSIAEIELEKIETNPYQPRIKFDEDAIGELADSIKELGIIQPITVRQLEKNKFQLISGERRLRASKIAGLKKIPCFIRKAKDQEMLEFALVENIQREDLNSIEIAITFQRLIDECKLTQEKLSERSGKRRSTVANYLRLLTLPPEIQAGIRAKKLSMGHAKALVTISDKPQQLKAFYSIISGGINVRDTEELVKEINNPTKNKKKQKKELPENFRAFKNTLSERLETKIDLKVNKKGKGKLTISFKSEDELDRIIKMIKEN